MSRPELDVLLATSTAAGDVLSGIVSTKRSQRVGPVSGP